MKQILYLCFALAIFFMTGCKANETLISKPSDWHSIATIEDVEIFIDRGSIRHDNLTSYATEERVYLSAESKNKYVDKIRNEYTKLGKPDKADKWNDFSYCIYHCLYECTNKRFKILSVEDFDSTGKRIIKTTPTKSNEKWLNVTSDTVGDHTLFFVCDYGQ